MNVLVIGIGGGGSNMIDFLSKSTFKEIKFLKINTDSQVLKGNRKIKTLQLGDGLGAGMKPEVGLEAAIEKKEDIIKHIKNVDLLFIAAGMGGGTGTGVAPYISELAKELNILNISILTKPFLFEGKKRLNLAKEGINKLNESSDAAIVIENQNLLSIIDRKAGIKESFMKVDEILSMAVNGVSGVLFSKGINDINLDFADLQTIFSHSGACIIGMGSSLLSAEEAIRESLSSKLLKENSIEKAKGIMIHFELHPDFPFLELGMSLSAIEDMIDDEDVEIIFGTTTNKKLKESEVKVVLIGTGIEDIKEDISSKEKEDIKSYRLSGVDYSNKTIVKLVS